MADLSKITCPNGTTVDILSKTTRGIVRATMESTSTSTAFVVTAPGIDSLYDGATFICKNTIVASAAGCTIDVNGLGAKSMFGTFQNATITTGLAKDKTYIFVFNYSTDMWEIYEGRDNNDNDTYTLVNYYSNPTAGVNGFKKYSLFARLADGTYSSFFTNAGGTGTKTFDTETEFDFSKVFYANISEDIAAGSVMTSDSTWYQCSISADMRYNFNGVTTKASTSSLHADAPVYLRVSCSTTKPGFFKIISPYFTQTPTFDGGIYVFLGYMRDSYRLNLQVHNPIYNCRAVTVDNTTTYVLDPWFEGTGNKTLNPNSHAEGYYNTASADNAHAEGNYTTASGNSSHAEGMSGTASGNTSHCEGYNGQAIAPTSHVEGYECVTYSDNSHAEGAHTTTGINGTQTFNAHAEGDTTTASASSSHSEGYGTTASGIASHAEGSKRNVGTEENQVWEGGVSSGYASHAEGYGTTASAMGAHAEGCSTVASGYVSHAEGGNTVASGSASHAEGDHTIAASSNQHVFGKFNIADDNNDYVEIIGNGSSDNARSNARTLDWYGNESISGTHSCYDTSYINNSTINAKSSTNGVSQTGEYISNIFVEKNGYQIGRVGVDAVDTGRIGVNMSSTNYNSSGTEMVSNSLILNSYKDGTASVAISHPDKWRDSLGLTNNQVANDGYVLKTGNIYCTSPSTDVSSIANNTNIATGTLKFPAGLYILIYYCRFGYASGSGYRYISINNSNAAGSYGILNQASMAGFSGTDAHMQLVSFLKFSSETSIYLRAYQNSGSTLSLAPRYNVIKLY